MTNTVVRPTHLPDFLYPPLNEVVMGVQFSAPKNYQQIYAGKVWDLYRDLFPEVQEQASLPPGFETFGISHQRIAVPLIRFDSGGSHDRFWFLRASGDELIQFQQDRLLHNWRQVEGQKNVYPRYEVMVNRFRSELMQLQDFMAALSPQTLLINQCEISYINHIQTGDAAGSTLSKWLKFIDFAGTEPDDFSLSTREVIRNVEGDPQGRLNCEISTGQLLNGDGAIIISLTVRGAPKGTDIDSALEFLAIGRDVIVSKFTELTTDEAHKIWGRIK